jgi:hypothetical protein
MVSQELQMFEEKDTLPLQCALQSLNILSAFPQHKDVQITKHISQETINKEMPWDFFMGPPKELP